MSAGLIARWRAAKYGHAADCECAVCFAEHECADELAKAVEQVRETLGRNIGNFCTHVGELNENGDCPACNRLTDEIMADIAAILDGREPEGR
jgi:hypothetical protein